MTVSPEHDDPAGAGPAGATVAGPRRWWRAADARSVLVMWGVFTVVGVVFALIVPHHVMGPPASDTMASVEATFTMFSVASAPVAALVWALAIHSLRRWRRKGAWTPGEEDGEPLRSSRGATGAWIAGSVALCLFLLIWGLAALSAVSSPAAAADPLAINVTGQQWVWSFSYPRNGGVESDQLYVPLNRPVVFKVTSDDVIHSFWVTEMGIKVDANPGMVTTTQTIPSRLGTYHVRCAELCGLLHADMETYVHVVTPREFSAWLASQGGRP